MESLPGSRIVLIDLKELLGRVLGYVVLGWVLFIFPFQQRESLKREELYEQQQDKNSAVLHYYVPNAPYVTDPQVDFDNER